MAVMTMTKSPRIDALEDRAAAEGKPIPHESFLPVDAAERGPRKVKKNAHFVALGRLGGQARSERKTAAVRRNALSGGRPRKFSVGSTVRANSKAPGGFRDRQGTIATVGPGRSEYGVAFQADPTHPNHGVLKSRWLDLQAEPGG